MAGPLVLQLFVASAIPVLKIVLLCGVGAFCARKGLLTPEGRRVLGALSFLVFNPSLIFVKLGSTLTPERLLHWWPLMLNTGISTAVGLGLGYLGVRLVRPPHSLKAATVVSIALGNLGNLPLVIVSSLAASSASILHGIPPSKAEDLAVAYVVIGLLFPVLAHATLGFSMLRKPNTALLPAGAEAEAEAGSGGADPDDDDLPDGVPPLRPTSSAESSDARPPSTVDSTPRGILRYNSKGGLASFTRAHGGLSGSVSLKRTGSRGQLELTSSGSVKRVAFALAGDTDGDGEERLRLLSASQASSGQGSEEGRGGDGEAGARAPSATVSGLGPAAGLVSVGPQGDERETTPLLASGPASTSSRATASALPEASGLQWSGPADTESEASGLGEAEYPPLGGRSAPWEKPTSSASPATAGEELAGHTRRLAGTEAEPEYPALDLAEVVAAAARAARPPPPPWPPPPSLPPTAPAAATDPRPLQLPPPRPSVDGTRLYGCAMDCLGQDGSEPHQPPGPGPRRASPLGLGPQGTGADGPGAYGGTAPGSRAYGCAVDCLGHDGDVWLGAQQGAPFAVAPPPAPPGVDPAAWAALAPRPDVASPAEQEAAPQAEGGAEARSADSKKAEGGGTEAPEHTALALPALEGARMSLRRSRSGFSKLRSASGRTLALVGRSRSGRHVLLEWSSRVDYRAVAKQVWREATSPPLLAILLSVPVGVIPPLQAALFGPSASDLCVLLVDCLSMLGECTIPAILLILGATLANGPGAARVPLRVTALVTVTRLALLPLVGMGLVMGAYAAHVYEAPDPIYLLVLLIQNTAPTAIMVHTMASVHGNAVEELSAILFWGYMIGILAIPLWLMLFLGVVKVMYRES
ncbi:hypothetical protein HYH03_000140 [Edaphochlamys debaryana]|uniref:Auxin efflux carrier n=1 Tax=Edaphochlamys debaryana TaxID=47281 RepID=A0A835YNC5_9CHLO|nr:hypothetical protein HYH03_000140 [Edaphochlamys debaryana]|eukprot:KAG2501635.1 hypothetical protein HYH03_000140 [Edaphochlamys debaryana]